MDKPRVLTVPEAGEQLGISRSFAYRAAREGLIPTVRIGRAIRVPVVALDRMLAEARPLTFGHSFGAGSER